MYIGFLFDVGIMKEYPTQLKPKKFIQDLMKNLAKTYQPEVKITNKQWNQMYNLAKLSKE